MLTVMPDEQYPIEDIPSYGAHQQPVLASRTRGHLRTTALGTGVAVVGLVAVLGGLLMYPDLDGGYAGRGWVVALACCAAAMVILCLWQHLSWRRASQVWNGRRDDDLGAVVAVSWILHLGSYAIALIALIVSVISLFEVGWFATTAIFVLVSLLALLAAQVLAGVQYVRAEGPPGVVPARMQVTHEHDQHRPS